MYDNKKILIFGMARSGYEVAKILADHNCSILITDKEEQDNEHIDELISLGIKYVVSEKQEDLLDNSYDYIIKNPGIRIDHPLCLKAKELNIPIINELEVAYHYLPKNVKIVGITGSNGKTTTTTLTYEILKEAKLPVHLGGNIGFPMSSLMTKVKENDILVLELSAQQLHDFKDFKVDVAILTNLTEVHLDNFKTFEYYMNTKKKIFDHSDVSIINKDDLNEVELTKDVKNKLYFSTKEEANTCVKENAIYYNDEKVIDLKDIKLKGMHNYQNAMCAILATKQFDISNKIIVKVLENFAGVEHRLEFVKKLNDREFYNDSKATNVRSTQIALSAFDKSTILLLGGLDRGHSFEGLTEYLKNVKLIVCYGETKNRINDFAKENNIECHVFNTLEESTKDAYKSSSKGDVILLSPACASWDQYKCFEDRGNEFKKIVNSLK